MPIDLLISALVVPWLAPTSTQVAARGPVHPPVTPLRVLSGYRPPPEPWQSGHRGIDLMARAGQPVAAPVDGRLTFSGDVAGRPVVTLTIASGLRLTFEPVRTDLSEGDRIRRGSPLGQLAPTGLGASHCGGIDPCLHVGLRSGDGYRDPRPFVLGLPVLKPTAPDLRTGSPR